MVHSTQAANSGVHLLFISVSTLLNSEEQKRKMIGHHTLFWELTIYFYAKVQPWRNSCHFFDVRVLITREIMSKTKVIIWLLPTLHWKPLWVVFYGYKNLTLTAAIICCYSCNFCYGLFVDCFQYMMTNLRVKSFLSEKGTSIMAQQSSWSVLLPRWLSLDW